MLFSFASKVETSCFKLEFSTMLRIENTIWIKTRKTMMQPKMMVDFFHFLEKVGPLWDEMDASSAAMIGSWEVFMVLVRMCQVSNILKYWMKHMNQACMAYEPWHWAKLLMIETLNTSPPPRRSTWFVNIPQCMTSTIQVKKWIKKYWEKN